MNVEQLAVALERAGIAGRIITHVNDVWRKARMFCAADPDATFGLDTLLPATLEEVMDSVRSLANTEFPPEGTGSWDRCHVDPMTTARQVDAAARRLRQACEAGERVLFATGHPAGPIDMYTTLAHAMAERGADLMKAGEAEAFPYEGGRAHLRYVGDVACLSAGGELLHTHSPVPMEYLLSVGPAPDLVVGDHGFTGLGLTRGADAVALVDTNDPALALAYARGLPIWPIACDDHRPPSYYEPMWEFLIERL